MEFVTRLQYEYAQVAVDLFYENLTPVHCSVVVCIHVSPLFLYLKGVNLLKPNIRLKYMKDFFIVTEYSVVV